MYQRPTSITEYTKNPSFTHNSLSVNGYKHNKIKIQKYVTLDNNIFITK